MFHVSLFTFNFVVSATELYDHGTDDGTDMDYLVTNVVGEPANAKVVAAMARIVREGWKQQRPSQGLTRTED